MQGVPELMEHGVDFVVRHQRGLARRRLRNIEMIADHGFRAGKSGLRHIGAGPGAAPLIGARVEVAEKETQRAAVRIEYFEHIHVRAITLQVLALFERDAIQLGRRVEHAVHQNAANLVIGPQLRAVEGEASPAHFLLVEGPIPRRNREAALFLVHDGLHRRRFFARVGHRCRGDLRQQLVHRRD